MRLNLASRRSDLARVQAYQVGGALEKAHPGLVVEYIFRESLGDVNQHDPLWKMPERGVFTEDFYAGLVSGEFDLVVHSWKDLPVAERDGTEIAATMARADQRDVLLMPKESAERASRAGNPALRILSSSPRRQHNLERLFTELLPFPGASYKFLPVRGNVPTRVRKLFQGEGDALIVAKAALDRLLSAERDEFRETRDELRARVRDSLWAVLPLSANPSAAAQGALAIEIAKNRSDLKKLLAPIAASDAFADVNEERRILAGYGGGCHQKIGVSVVRGEFGRVVSLRGETDAGETLDRFDLAEKREIPACGKGGEFPRKGEAPRFFERRPLKLGAAPKGPILVAKPEALPDAWKIPFSQLVWAAGISTWKKLAARGIWVSGTFDGLGEGNPRIQDLAGGPVGFTKLTHSGGSRLEGAEFLATYELVPRSERPDLTGRTHFYWMSGSQFDAALMQAPEIRKGHHAAGPGSTYRHIRTVLGGEDRLHVRLSYDEWLREILR